MARSHRRYTLCLLAALGALLVLGSPLTAAGANGYQGSVTLDGARGYWTLDDSSGNTLSDSINGHDAMANGGVTLGVPGPTAAQSAAAFDGSSGYADVPWWSGINVTPPYYSIEAWVDPASVGGQVETILSSEGSGGGYSLNLTTTGQASFCVNTISGTACAQSSAAVQPAAWTYLAGVLTARSATDYLIQIYANGALTGSTDTNAKPLSDVSDPFRIGADNVAGSPANYFYGSIADVAYYPKGLGSTSMATRFKLMASESASPAPPPTIVITGDASQGPGTVLTAVPGSWTGAGITFHYQWQRCTSPTNCVNIPGATNAGYTVSQNDAGLALRALVTGQNSAGSYTKASALTAQVPANPPVNTALPSVSPTGGMCGQTTLQGTNGNWTGSQPIAYSYQWQFSSDSGATWNDIPGATAASYAVDCSYIGDELSLMVTATNAGGSVSANSAATAAVESPAPVNTNTPVIGGQATDGQTLTTVSNGSWSGAAPLTYSYQWQFSVDGGATWADIPTATTTSFQLPYGTYTGDSLQLVVTATNSHGSLSASSNTLGPVVAAPPTSTAAPTISGLAQVGQLLSATPGTWTGSPTISYSYQWQSSPSGTSWTAIGGATSSSYTVQIADIGNYLRVVVTASNSAGNISSSSNSVGQVAAVAPINTALPTISGTATDGQTVTASSGSWLGTAPIAYGYQWEHSASSSGPWVAIAGMTSSSLAIPYGSYTGAYLAVKVTATNSAGNTSVTTIAVGPIAAGVPVNTAVPTVSGTAKETQTLTATVGSWTGTPTLTYAYQWQSATSATGPWSNIAGATSSTFLIPYSTYTGHFLRMLVSATNAAGTVSASSAATTAVAVNAVPPTNSAIPVISGTSTVGQLLNATSGSWNGAPTISYTYQWQSSASSAGPWSNISGATTASYTEQPVDYSNYLRVQVIASNTYGNATAYSSALGPVAGTPPVNIAAPTLSGTTAPTYTLTATTGTWTGTAPITYSYQWQSSTDNSTWTNIAGATTTTYALLVGDYSHYIRVVVTATGPAGWASKPSAGEQITGRVVTIDGTNYDIDATGSVSVPYTGAAETLVPLNSFTVTFKLWGASGGYGLGPIPGGGGTQWSYPGGGGGYTTASVALTAGTSYTLVVGGEGASGNHAAGGFGGGGTGGAGSGTSYWNGGGGGYTGLFNSSSLTQANALLMAGGGGGAGSTNSTTLSSLGGAGGGTSGEQLSGSAIGEGYGGFGGTQTAGGARGADGTDPGGAGSALKGGVGGVFSGGGGGGYYGGGGGSGAASVSGGGGGGSGFCRTLSSITNCATTAGTYNIPANNNDPDLNGTESFDQPMNGLIVLH